MYSRILVPLDGSELAEQVLPYVKALGKAYQAPITLLRVFDPVPAELGDSAHGVYIDRIATSFRNEALTYLDQAGAALKELDLPISTVSHEGDPASCIIAEAEKTPDTIIAMATHGRSGITRWLLGSVTDRVLHATSCPLMIIRAKPQEEFNQKDLQKDLAENGGLTSIIVPLDGSKLAERILPHAALLAKGLDLPVTLLRVTDPINQYRSLAGYPSLEGAGKMQNSMYEDMAREDEKSAMDYLLGIKEELGQLGVARTKEVVLRGRADSSVVNLASSTPGSLVAMTTRGLSGVGRWVLGSVTDRVVRYSGDPVLVVRAPREAALAGAGKETAGEAASREKNP